MDFAQYKEALEKEKSAGADSVLLVKKDDNAGKFGFIKVENGRVTELAEKPEPGLEHSGLRVVGIYLFGRDFLDILSKTEPGANQLEDAISKAAGRTKISYVETKQSVPTLKYPWDLLDLKNYLLEKMVPHVSEKATIGKNAIVEENVIVEDGAQIMEGACVKGPCYIGKDAYVGNNALVRDGVDIEEGVSVGANAELRNTLFMAGSTIHSGFVGDSIIGKNCKIAAYFCTANVRLDKESVKVQSESGEAIDTGIMALGIMTGSNVRVGIRVSTMPGVQIGESAIIGPGTTVMKSVPPKVKHYTKFETVTENGDK